SKMCVTVISITLTSRFFSSRSRRDWMKPVIPHEHGGWVFLFVPLILGTWFGKPSSIHIWLFLAWLFFYMGSYAFREWLKRGQKDQQLFGWMLSYGALATACFALPLWQEPSLL